VGPDDLDIISLTRWVNPSCCLAGAEENLQVGISLLGKAAIREHGQVELKPVILLLRTTGTPGRKEDAFEAVCLFMSFTKQQRPDCPKGQGKGNLLCNSSDLQVLLCGFCDLQFRIKKTKDVLSMDFILLIVSSSTDVEPANVQQTLHQLINSSCQAAISELLTY